MVRGGRKRKGNAIEIWSGNTDYSFTGYSVSVVHSLNLLSNGGDNNSQSPRPINQQMSRVSRGRRTNKKLTNGEHLYEWTLLPDRYFIMPPNDRIEKDEYFAFVPEPQQQLQYNLNEPHDRFKECVTCHWEECAPPVSSVSFYESSSCLILLRRRQSLPDHATSSLQKQ